MKLINKLLWLLLIFLVIFSFVFLYTDTHRYFDSHLKKNLNITLKQNSIEKENDSLSIILDSLIIYHSQLKTATKTFQYEQQSIEELKKEIPVIQ